jgi:hypothetical protein
METMTMATKEPMTKDGNNKTFRTLSHKITTTYTMAMKIMICRHLKRQS